MWTATLKNKTDSNGILSVTVDFSNGTKTITETCRSAYITDIKAWVRSRINEFTKAEELDAALVVDAPIDYAEEVVVNPQPTAEEVAFMDWLTDFSRMERVQKLIDMGIVLATNAKVVALKDRLKNNLQASYIDNL